MDEELNNGSRDSDHYEQGDCDKDLVSIYVEEYKKLGSGSKHTVSVSEICKMFCLSRTLIDSWIREGKLKPVERLGGRSEVYLLADAITEYDNMIKERR